VTATHAMYLKSFTLMNAIKKIFESIRIDNIMLHIMFVCLMVFLFVAVLFMSEVQKEQKAIKEIAEGYQNIQSM
jgi:hypothetical protein